MEQVEVKQADIDLAEAIMRRVKDTIEHTLGQPVLVSHNALPELLALHRIATETHLTALLDQAEEALGPFAKYADPRKVVAPDYQISPGSSFAKPQLTMGDCYSAVAALTAIRQGRGK